MTARLASEATIAANLRWFAMIYLAALLVVVALVSFAAANGISIPSAGLGLGAFAGAVTIAGRRFALRRDYRWASTDRHVLALGYVGLAIVLSVALVGTAAMISPEIGAGIVDLYRETPAGFIGALLAIVMIYYALARLMLRFIANRGERK